MGEYKRTLIEMTLVGLVALAAGFLANHVNAFGLVLSRNYIVKKVEPPTKDPEVDDTVYDSEFTEGGFRIIKHEDVVKLFNDPLYAGGLYVIIDARDEEQYADGHIPGAYQLDPWRYTEDQLKEMLNICLTAEKVALYCKGGECEDSEMAADLLIQNDVIPGSIHVYSGGFDRWSGSRMPVEKGARNSGDIGGGNS
ncbi:MAG: rhodanese-like domain-containing protein [Planctomycetota bacterium]|nr:MAG: rhodanese-like domain-containing protein [Planctomycetota bacterium]